MFFDWWGITIGLSSLNIQQLAGTPPYDFKRILNNIFPNQGTAINIISSALLSLIKNLSVLNSGSGVWVKILYNYNSLRWGIQVGRK